MKKIDVRFDDKTMQCLKSMIGQKFIKYRCDPFKFTNSVYLTVGIFIGAQTYELKNEIQVLDYYGQLEDVAVLTLQTTTEEKLKSGIMDGKQIDMPIGEKIKEIHLINENQRIYQKGKQSYDVWLTRGIIFVLSDREVSFEKEIWFSEDININRGYDLINTFASTDKFLEGWEEDNDILPECSREVIIVK